MPENEKNTEDQDFYISSGEVIRMLERDQVVVVRAGRQTGKSTMAEKVAEYLRSKGVVVEGPIKPEFGDGKSKIVILDEADYMRILLIGTPRTRFDILEILSGTGKVPVLEANRTICPHCKKVIKDETG